MLQTQRSQKRLTSCHNKNPSLKLPQSIVSKNLLCYLYIHPKAQIRCRTCQMILQIHFDALYFSGPKAYSTACGFYFLGWYPRPNYPIWLNRHIHILCKILDVVCTFTVEAKLGGICLNAQIPIAIYKFINLGHPQPSTPIHTDNKTTCGSTNNTMKEQKIKLNRYAFFWI